MMLQLAEWTATLLETLMALSAVTQMSQLVTREKGMWPGSGDARWS